MAQILLASPQPKRIDDWAADNNADDGAHAEND
jgi:hypothetical protein